MNGNTSKACRSLHFVCSMSCAILSSKSVMILPVELLAGASCNHRHSEYFFRQCQGCAMREAEQCGKCLSEGITWIASVRRIYRSYIALYTHLSRDTTLLYRAFGGLSSYSFWDSFGPPKPYPATVDQMRFTVRTSVSVVLIQSSSWPISAKTSLAFP